MCEWKLRASKRNVGPGSASLCKKGKSPQKPVFELPVRPDKKPGPFGKIAGVMVKRVRVADPGLEQGLTWILTQSNIQYKLSNLRALVDVFCFSKNIFLVGRILFALLHLIRIQISLCRIQI